MVFSCFLFHNVITLTYMFSILITILTTVFYYFLITHSITSNETESRLVLFIYPMALLLYFALLFVIYQATKKELKNAKYEPELISTCDDILTIFNSLSCYNQSFHHNLLYDTSIMYKALFGLFFCANTLECIFNNNLSFYHVMNPAFYLTIHFTFLAVIQYKKSNNDFTEDSLINTL